MSQTETLDDPFADLELALGETMLADRPGLRRRLHGLRRRRRAGRPISRGLAELRDLVAASGARVQARRAALPRPDYPDGLPVVEMRAEIAAAIAAHQVVIVCGETGSGKTTQLPKVCLELGRGVHGLIGHTQPRRIAARSVAARIAEELHSELGGAVGYKVRFGDHVGAESHIKLMTDGILLAELQRDTRLEQYDTLIVDEAHERSLNIDFLLGYLKRLLPQRPDLKLIITSATIDPESFSRFFDDAPIVSVPGRTYPVEVRYRPLTGEPDAGETDLPQAVVEAVDELTRGEPGDALVFLPGEREIRESAEALRKHHPPGVEVLPLFARLGPGEQQRIFEPHGRPRIVLATNVAETSLTVPGIRYVVDSGLARISRYSHRSKVQRLPIEKIARASADQRKGRCGRTGPGICLRLYAEQDFLERPHFTEPEIQRTNLAEVILQMRALGLGELEDFPFVDPPDRRFINDGYRLLHELGAVDERRALTELGRRLARLPVDPRIARMLVAAEREGSLAEVLPIAAALSVADPRVRPAEAQGKADAAHALFRNERSDFLSLLQLWRAYQEQKRHLSRSKLRRWCQSHYLSYVRMLEWEGVYKQLHGLMREGGARVNQVEADDAAVHRALLTGLLGHVAVKEDKDRYSGARGTTLHIFPGSGLARKGPKWLMAAELVETSRLFARTVAAIEPRWIEALAGHLLKRSYSHPHWERKGQRVVASEQSTLYGLIVNPGRRVNYARIDAAAARELFIREALVRGDYRSRGEFLAHNLGLVREVEALEHRSRRRDILEDEESLFAFYDARIPAAVADGPSFEAWRKQAEREQPRLLYFERAALMLQDADHVSAGRFPETLRVGALELPLSYHFEPGAVEDGVSVTVPLAALNQLPAERFDWLVPGLLNEKLTALIRALPKGLRRNFVPAPNFAAALEQRLSPREGALLPAMAGELQRMTGVSIPADAWRLELLPEHLRMNFRVMGPDGTLLGHGRDLEALRAQLGGRAARDFERLPAHDLERETVSDWDFGALPESVSREVGGVRLQGFPALVEETDRVALRLLDTPEQAQRAHRRGLLRLLQTVLREQVRYLQRNLPQAKAMCLHYAPVGGCESLKADIVDAAFERVFLAEPLPREAEAFQSRLAAGRARLVDEANALAGQVAAALAEYHALARALKGGVAPQWLSAVGDVREQLERLIYPGFVAGTPAAWLGELPRFLKAISVRLQRLEQNPQRDRQPAASLAPLWEGYWAVRRPRPELDTQPEWVEFRWLLEELRVSLFAQELGTSCPVSAKRLEARWRELSRPA